MTASLARSAARSARPGGCYVYIQLPGTTTVVTCGRYEHQVLPNGSAIGRFAYGQSYLARTDAVPIDPYHLPLRRGTVETARLGGIFGAIRDAAPDSWGQRVIERALGRTELSILDLLLHSPEDRIGALSFGNGLTPPAVVRPFNRVIQLPVLLEVARQVEEESMRGRPLDPQIHDLLVQGSSALGGARPKNVVEDERGLWVAKFPAKGDRWNNAAVEAAMLGLARRCDIQAPPTRIEQIGSQSVLLVKRFDRDLVVQADDARSADARYLRHRMVSALTVLDAEDLVSERRNWSYLLLADELQRWSARPTADRHELFRRMVLNALVSNMDDHPRNHALIAPGPEFHLAPVYDVTPQAATAIDARHLALEVGRFGRVARRDNLVSLAPRFSLPVDEAHGIIDRMKAIIAREWEGEIRRQGGTAADCHAVQNAFVYAGFEYPSDKQT